MSETKPFVHPYIPNSAPQTRAQMLEAIGVADAADLYDGIPEQLKLNRPLDLPPPILAERDLRRHVAGMLQKNTSTADVISFLGGGCWQHDVPAVCDEINSRAEFLTAYGGDTYADLGKYQAIFEFQSMIGELVGMEMVSAPVYDWTGATTSALMMASRITGRRKVLLAGTVAKQTLSHLANHARAWLDPVLIEFDPDSGQVDLDDLRGKLSDGVAAVYVEVPSYLGAIEGQAAEIANAGARGRGADASSGSMRRRLGCWRRRRTTGPTSSSARRNRSGSQMQYSGGLCGFIASRDEPEYVMEYPYLMVSIAPGRTEGEFGFGWSTMERTSYDKREYSPDYAGTTQWLWGITAAVYLSLLGPQGLRELGEGIMQRSHYAMRRLGQIPGVRSPRFEAAHFKEFVVDFTATGKTVESSQRRAARAGHLRRARSERGVSRARAERALLR